MLETNKLVLHTLTKSWLGSLRDKSNNNLSVSVFVGGRISILWRVGIKVLGARGGTALQTLHVLKAFFFYCHYK